MLAIFSYLNGVVEVLNGNVTEVAAGIGQYETAGYLPQGVKAHLQLDESGILRLTEVNLLMTNFAVENKTDGDSALKSKFA